MNSAISAKGPYRRHRFNPDRDVEEWHGKYLPYDLVKEFIIAFVVVAVLVAGLAVIFSSPDEKPVTVKSWSTADPVGFAQTAITELDGTSAIATYGPPYNSATGSSQSIGPISPESWFGVHHPIDTANDYVINPLKTLPDRPAWLGRSAATPRLDESAGRVDHRLREGRGQRRLLRRLSAGALRSLRTSGHHDRLADFHGPERCVGRGATQFKQFYGTDYTKPLLFIADGTYLANLAQGQHLQGSQWGMMNETGKLPGQAWLWLYTLWYQVPPMKTSSNADFQVWGIMMILTLVLALVPFIPGLRSIPRWSRVYRLIWRQHYRDLAEGTGGT